MNDREQVDTQGRSALSEVGATAKRRAPSDLWIPWAGVSWFLWICAAAWLAESWRRGAVWWFWMGFLNFGYACGKANRVLGAKGVWFFLILLCELCVGGWWGLVFCSPV